MEGIRRHDVVLEGAVASGLKIRLRPMTDADFGILARWNRDPEVLYFSEGENVFSYSTEEVRGIYAEASRTAFCFMISAEGRLVGECWLQRMNLERILSAHPGVDCRRIDLMLGEKECWGRGIGTETIRLLTRFGFEREGAGMVFGVGIADYNQRSLKAFQKAGYRTVGGSENPKGSKAKYTYDTAFSREDYFRMKQRETAVSGEGETLRLQRLARVCQECPVCRLARAKQKGLAFWFVKNVEGRICPACKAYEKIHGRKAHEPLS